MINILKTTFLGICFFVSGAKGYTQSAIPNTWQPNMKLVKTFCCGRRPGYDSLVICLGTGKFSSTDNTNTRNKTILHFSQARLDSLLMFLNKQHFAEIKTVKRRDIVYDMGNSAIFLYWDGHVVTVEENGAEQIAEDQQEHMQVIRAYLEKMIKEE